MMWQRNTHFWLKHNDFPFPLSNIRFYCHNFLKKIILRIPFFSKLSLLKNINSASTNSFSSQIINRFVYVSELWKTIDIQDSAPLLVIVQSDEIHFVLSLFLNITKKSKHLYWKDYNKKSNISLFYYQ